MVRLAIDEISGDGFEFVEWSAQYDAQPTFADPLDVAAGLHAALSDYVASKGDAMVLA